MKKLDAQDADTGRSQESKSKQSKPASKPTKIGSENLKVLQISQSENGSTQTLKSQKKSLSESEQDNGSEIIPKKKLKHPMPVPKLQALESRTLKALKRLKVKPEALESTPQITPMLKSSLKGGLKTALEAMRFASNDTEIALFLKVYDKVPIGDRERLPWEAIMLSAKVNPVYLLGAIQLAVQNHCWNRSRFMAVSNHPDITEKRIKYAKMAGGEKDRTALDIMMGTLPSPKGQTFIGKQVAVFGGTGKQGAEGNILDAETDSADGVDDLFPNPTKIQEALVPIRQRLLEG